MDLQRNPTHSVRIGSISIGTGHPIAVQSMTATHTQNIDATVGQVNDLQAAGADVVRVAVDNNKDAEALAAIRAQTTANLSVDLQENYRLARLVAPHVDKVRYNPGHLYHHEREKPWQDKVKFLVDVAAQNDCALRVGVNCGSVDPAKLEKFDEDDSIGPMLESAWEHCELLDSLGFTNYCVSLKDSDPAKVIEVNRRFAAQRPDVPLHLGVTEAGLPPEGIIKTRIAFEQLISRGIGDTIRVSLTVPNARKGEEIVAGRQILSDIAAGRVRSVVDFGLNTLNIISCPSCSRVENEAFIELAQDVKTLTQYAREHAITIAVMGCRVNGPGETDDADLGLWCGPNFVNLKRGSRELGAFPYDAILPRLKQELDELISAAHGACLISFSKSSRFEFIQPMVGSRMTGRSLALLAPLLFASLSGCAKFYSTPALPSRNNMVLDQLVIFSDSPLPEHHRLLMELRSQRSLVSTKLGLPISDEPIHVYLFPTAEKLASYLRVHYPTLPRRRAFFVESDTRLTVYAYWGDRVAEDLRHEVAHGYLHAIVPNLPLWLDEGLAEYFEVSRGQAGLNQPHLEQLAGDSAPFWQPDLKRLERLKGTDEMSQKEYAQSWAWVHYLLESTPERQQILRGYLQALAKSQIVEPLSEQVKRADPHCEQHLADHLAVLRQSLQ